MVLYAVQDECTFVSCPKMTVSNEWQYLCAAHKRPQECPAYRYMLHTVPAGALLGGAVGRGLHTLERLSASLAYGLL